MTQCKQTPPAGAASGHALNSPGLSPACPGEGNGPGGSESQRPRTLDNTVLTDGKGKDLFSTRGEVTPTLVVSNFFPVSEDGWSALGEHPSFPHAPSCSVLRLCRSPSNSLLHLHTSKHTEHLMWTAGCV